MVAKEPKRAPGFEVSREVDGDPADAGPMHEAGDELRAWVGVPTCLRTNPRTSRAAAGQQPPSTAHDRCVGQRPSLRYRVDRPR